jgi:hypothetical protein
MLFITLAAFAPGPVVMGSYFMKDMAQLEGPPPERLIMSALLLLVYFPGFGLLLFYVVFGPYRYALADDGLVVRGVFGVRRVRWQDVRSAHISIQRRTATLVLRTGRFRGARLCLSDFRRPRSLLEAIRPLLPVPIRVHDWQMKLIPD